MYHLPATLEELQALAQLIDGGVRHHGIAAAEAAALWKRKIEAAEPEEPAPEVQ